MKYLRILLAISTLLTVIGCKPDLVVKSLDVTWDATNKTAVAEIANIGNANASSFMVYFDAKENPESQNHIPQVRIAVESLAKGATITLNADFAPLAHPDNQNLANVFKMVVTADSKSMVEESNENNNQMEEPIP